MKKYNNDIHQAIVEYNYVVDMLCEEIKTKLKVNPEALSLKDMLKVKDLKQDIFMKQYRDKLNKRFKEMYDAYTVDLEKFHEKMDSMNIDDLK